MNTAQHRSFAEGMARAKAHATVRIAPRRAGPPPLPPARRADCPVFVALEDEPGICCYCDKPMDEHSERALSDRPADPTPGPGGAIEAFCPPT
jgi:hypothetical protein